MCRLLGRNPVDGVEDRRVAEIFAASHAIRPVGKPFDDLLSDMAESALEAHLKEIVAMWPDLSQKGEKEKARQSLIELVEGEIERVSAIADEQEENAGEDAVRLRALRSFVNSPKADAMRRWFVRAKGSVERGLGVIRKEIKARKADRDGERLPPVPGKDISPYDGRPAAWWRESAGDRKAGRRTEGGGRRTDGGDLREAGRRAEGGGRGQEGLVQGRDGDCGSGGIVAGGGSDAAVESGRETQADGTPFGGAHDGRSVPATSNEKRRGWDSVVVEESDVLACGGYLPERCAGIAGEGSAALEDEGSAAHGDEGSAALEDEGSAAHGDEAFGALEHGARAAVGDEAPAALEHGAPAGDGDEVSNLEMASSEFEEAGTCEREQKADGVVEVTREGLADDGRRAGGEQGGDHDGEGSTLAIREDSPTSTGDGTAATRGEGNAPNEPNLCDDEFIVQHQEIIEVATDSGGVSGVEGCQTNPIFSQTKPIPAGGGEAGGVGGSATQPAERALTEYEAPERLEGSQTAAVDSRTLGEGGAGAGGAREGAVGEVEFGGVERRGECG